MPTFYIDPSAATNGNGSLANPFNTWAGVPWAAGNAYLQKAGTQFVTAVGSAGRIAPSASGTSAARILIGAYGEGSRPRIYNRADTGFNLDRRSYITLQDFDIDNTEATAAGVGGGGDTAAESVGLIVQGCYIHGGNVEGMSFITQANRLGTRSLLVQRNIIENVGGHGIICAGEHDSTIVRQNKVTRAGFAAPRHGISAYAHRATTTPTWTLVSGSIYKTAIGAQTYKTTVTDIYGVLYRNAGRTLARAATATAPGSWEYGFSGGELFINVGGVPAGQITFSYTSLSVIFERNIVMGVVDFDGNEGHGIQLDDLASDSLIRGNRISSCEGRGIQINMGRRNRVVANVVENCKRGGIRADVNGAVLNAVSNNTVISGAATASPSVGIVLGADNTARSNVVLSFDTGITGTSTSTESNNLINAPTIRSGGIAAGSGSFSADPLLGAYYRPTADSPLIGAGAPLDAYPMLDAAGVQFNRAPTIGAFEYVRPRAGRRV